MKKKTGEEFEGGPGSGRHAGGGKNEGKSAAKGSTGIQPFGSFNRAWAKTPKDDVSMYAGLDEMLPPGTGSINTDNIDFMKTDLETGQIFIQRDDGKQIVVDYIDHDLGEQALKIQSFLKR